MTVAHDVFAETNPAFCTYVLAGFAAAYISVREHGPDLPLGYVALPIALSGGLACFFEGTNRRTGLLEWLNRSPQVQLGLADRVNASMPIVTEAIRFGCFARVLTFEPNGRIALGERKIPRNALAGLSDGPSRSMKHAERLGYWFAMAGSARTTLDMMGLTV